MFKLIFFIFLPCIYASRWSEFPAFSANSSKNLHSLAPSSLVSFLKSNNLSVIWFHPKNISLSDRFSYYLLRESFLTPAAERLQIPVAEYPVSNESSAILRTLDVNDTDIDTIHIYSRLRRIVYYGLRTPDALVSFVEKLKCPRFTLIEGKADKKLFDLLDKIRVLAHVVPGSAFARAYAHASLAFGPSVKFFVITDDMMARRYGLTDGSVQLHRPGERSFVELPRARSSAEIVTFVRDEAGKSFFQTHRLTAENIYSFFRERYDQPKFVLLTSASHSPHSSRFHKLLRRSVKNDTSCQISVIDVDQFPGMAEYWRKNYRVDPTVKPVLGYLNLSNRTAVWLGQELLNNTEGKESESHNNRAISDFVGSILNGTTTLKDGKQVDVQTGLPTDGDRDRQGHRQVEEGRLIDMKTLQDEVLAHEGSYENEDAFGIYNTDKKRLNYEGGKDYREDPTARVWEAGRTAEQPEDRPYFIIEDEPMFRKENPASKFGQDLTSFGTHTHLDMPSPSVAAHSKRHDEF